MSTKSTTTAALAKKSMKARFTNKKNDLNKLRDDLRKRCKHRMKVQREELLNQKRFGIASFDDVDEKLKEIFHTELNELATTNEYEVREKAPEIIKKVIENEVPPEPLTDGEKLLIEDYHKFKDEEKSNLLKEKLEEE